MKGLSPSEQADLLLNYLKVRGQAHYEEDVTQLEHALQSALLARTAGKSSEMIVSALFHDFGHLLVDEQTASGESSTTDLNHEEVGAEYLSPFFGPAVIEPIRLHVPAKRYLCAMDPSYSDRFSDASKKSFVVQGGAMSAEECAEMEKHPLLKEALELRRWDDTAKVDGLETPTVEDFRDDVITALKAK